MCMVALYANTIITSEVSLQYFIEERFPSMQLPPSAYSATIKHSRSALIKRWLLHHEEGGAAPAYILFNGMVAAVLVLLPYKILIEFTMTVMGPPTLLFLASFVALRIQEPDLEREFKIPARPIETCPVALAKSRLMAGRWGAGWHVLCTGYVVRPGRFHGGAALLCSCRRRRRRKRARHRWLDRPSPVAAGRPAGHGPRRNRARDRRLLPRLWRGQRPAATGYRVRRAQPKTACGREHFADRRCCGEAALAAVVAVIIATIIEMLEKAATQSRHREP